MRRFIVALISLMFVFGLSRARVIKVGSSMAFSGPYSLAAQQIANGIKLAFDEANSKGVLGGDRLVFIAYDDGYNPATTVVNLQKLFNKDRVDFLLAVFGTPNSIATAERLDYYNSVLFFPITGFSQLYKGVLSKRVFTLLPSYQDEASQLVEVARKNGAKSIGVIYYSNLYGFDVVDAARYKARSLGMKFYRYPAASYTQVRDILAKVLSDRPDALLFAVPLSYVKPMVEGMARADYYPQLYSEFYSRVPDALDALPPAKARRFKKVYTGMFLPLLSENYPMIKAYINAARKKGTTPNFVEFGGYVLGSTLVKVLSLVGSWRDANDLITRVERIRDLDIGLHQKISYSPTDHIGLTKVFIYRVEGEKFVRVR